MNFKKIQSIGNCALSQVNVNPTIKFGEAKFEPGALKYVKGVKTVIFTDDYKEDNIPRYFLSSSLLICFLVPVTEIYPLLYSTFKAVLS